jgi:hypothetical protein
MRRLLDAFVRLALFAVTVLIWVWCRNQPVSATLDVSAVVGAVVLVYPVVWIARRLLDQQPTECRAVCRPQLTTAGGTCEDRAANRASGGKLRRTAMAAQWVQ